MGLRQRIPPSVLSRPAHPRLGCSRTAIGIILSLIAGGASGADPGLVARRLERGELELLSVREGAASRHVRLRQIDGGRPVLGSSITIHFGRDGRVIRATERSFKLPPMSAAEVTRPEDAGRAAREAMGAAADLYETLEPRLSVIPEGPRLVYECRVRRRSPPGSFRVVLDAESLIPIEIEDCRRAFDGEGRVFNPNPVVALKDPTLRDQNDAADAVPEAAYRTVALLDLEGGGTAVDPYTLTGPHLTTGGTPGRARDIAGQFLFDRSDPRFEEVMVYYHIDSIQRRIQSLGFDSVCRRQVQAYVNSQPPGIPFPLGQSYYDSDGQGTGILAFGTGGADSAEDGEIIAHEYGHAILDNQVPNFGKSRQAVALAEGFCDFLAAAHFAAASGGFGDECFADWKATTSGPNPPFCMRRLDNRKRYPYDMTYGDRYQDSEIWSGALWDLVLRVGADIALAIALEGNFFLEEDASFPEAAEALLLADRELFEGANLDTLREVLEARGLLRPPPRIEGFTIRDEDPDAAIPDGDPFGMERSLEYPNDDRILSSLSLQVFLDLTHTYPTDLTVTLVSPLGTEVPLTPPWSFPTVYGSLDQPPAPGFAPLAGESARGTWRLRIADGKRFETGFLRAWGIRIQNLIRGDATADGQIDIADPVRILEHLFAGADLACETRADSNDDGAADISDPIYLLFWLFTAGPAPPPPFEAPGADPTPDALTCAG